MQLNNSPFTLSLSKGDTTTQERVQTLNLIALLSRV